MQYKVAQSCATTITGCIGLSKVVAKIKICPVWFGDEMCITDAHGCLKPQTASRYKSNVKICLPKTTIGNLNTFTIYDTTHG